MTKYTFTQLVVAEFTVKAANKRNATRAADRLFRDGNIVSCFTEGAAGIPVHFYRYLPHGSADASEPELVDSGNAGGRQ